MAVLLAGCDSGGSGDGGCDDCIQPPVEYQDPVDGYPAWGPDGRIAYTHWPQNAEEAALGEGLQVWVLDPATGEREFVAVGWRPAWSPDGSRLAYVLGGDIYIVEVETGEVTRLTGWGSCFNPSWSPDGEWIAFDTNHDDPRGANVIWIMRADGSEKTDISEHGVGEWQEPVWSPDGEWLLHIRYVSEQGNLAPELFLMHSNGTEPIRLTRSTRDDNSPSWSPDGRHIAWSSIGEGRDPTSGLWVMNANGSGQRLLVAGGYAPSWSPDGSRLVYHANIGSLHTTLWTVDADGSDPQPLTRPEDYPIP